MRIEKENTVLFFLDAMLGNIAKKLRLLGYDSKYYVEINDNDLLNMAKIENRIIVSKDKMLIHRSEKRGIKSILITKEDEIGQFLEIIRHENLKISQINGDTARCPKCNSETKEIEKNIIKEKIPERIFTINERFWICESCNQIYWEGTHIRNLQKFVSEINERLS